MTADPKSWMAQRNRMVAWALVLIVLPFAVLLLCAMLCPRPIPIALRIGMGLSIPVGLLIWWLRCRPLLRNVFSASQLRATKQIAVASACIAILILAFQWVLPGNTPEAVGWLVMGGLPFLVYLCVLYRFVELTHLSQPTWMAILTFMAAVCSVGVYVLLAVLWLAASVVFGFEAR